MKKIAIIFTCFIMLLSSGLTCSAMEGPIDSPASVSGDGISPRWTAIASISPQYYLESGKLHAYLIVTPYKNGTIDYVKVVVHIRDVNDNSVKKWSQTLYADGMGDFVFGETYTPSRRGEYYMSASIEAYKNGAVIDTAAYDSPNVTF